MARYVFLVCFDVFNAVADLPFAPTVIAPSVALASDLRPALPALSLLLERLSTKVALNSLTRSMRH